MKILLLNAAVLVWLHSSANAEQVKAVDLTTIPRSIAGEPEYATENPTYCLAVLGLRAEHRVWLIRDGDRLFVDRNGNGDLTEPGEMVDRTGSFTVDSLNLPKAADRYTRLQLYPLSGGTCKMRLSVRDRGLQFVGWAAETRPKFGSSPADAPVVHFDGPMMLSQYRSMQTLPRVTDGRSYRKTSLKLVIGTPGLGPGTFTADHCRCRRTKTLQASIEYPMRDGSRRSVPTEYKMHG